MPQVAKAEIKARAARLRAAGSAASAAHVRGLVGRTHRVLIEKPRAGRTESFAEVTFDTDQPVGQIVNARVSGLTEDGIPVAMPA